MQIGFVPSAHQPYTGPELMDAGDVPVIIEDVVAERAKDPASGLLKVTFVVQQGHRYAGRKIFYRLNIWNVSQASKDTAHKQLTSLCYACGIQGELPDTDMLKNRQCIIELTNDGTYNNVKIVKDMAGNIPGKSAVQSGAPGGPGMPSFGGAPAGAIPGGFTPPQAGPGAPMPPGNPFAPQAGPLPPAAPAVAAPPPPVAFPPPGWTVHPSAPGYYYQGQVVKTEAELRAMVTAPAAAPFGAPAGFVAPQAQTPANPAAGFTPGGQAQPPAGWPA